MFRFLDEAGVQGKTAVAHLVLGSEEQITVRAGGPGIHSWPVSGPYQQYEVLTSDEAPRFWSKYGDAAGVLYARVPRLLLTHLVTRRGGVRDMQCEVKQREVFNMVDVQLRASNGAGSRALSALRAIAGVEVVSTLFSPDVVV